MKKFLTLIMAAMLLAVSAFAFTACDKNEATSAIADGKLTIGYTDYAPMNYYDVNNNNKLIGFDTELAKAFCEKLGVTAEFVEINWDNKFIDLESKAIDCIWNGMTITSEVSEKTAVSKSYYTNKQVVVCRVEDAGKYTDKNSILTATSVIFESGSAGELAAKAVGVPENKQVPADKQANTLLEVKTGASDIAIIDLLMASFLTGAGTDFAELTYVDVGFDTEDFGVAFRKVDLGLAKAFDLFIELSKGNGTFDALADKYFN